MYERVVRDVSLILNEVTVAPLWFLGNDYLNQFSPLGTPGNKKAPLWPVWYQLLGCIKSIFKSEKTSNQERITEKDKTMPNSNRCNEDFQWKTKKDCHLTMKRPKKFSKFFMLHYPWLDVIPFTFLTRDNYSHSKDCRNLCWFYTSGFVRGYQVLLQMPLQVSPPSNWTWVWSNKSWKYWWWHWSYGFARTKHNTLVWLYR